MKKFVIDNGAFLAKAGYSTDLSSKSVHTIKLFQKKAQYAYLFVDPYRIM